MTTTAVLPIHELFERQPDAADPDMLLGLLRKAMVVAPLHEVEALGTRSEENITRLHEAGLLNGPEGHLAGRVHRAIQRALTVRYAGAMTPEELESLRSSSHTHLDATGEIVQATARIRALGVARPLYGEDGFLEPIVPPQDRHD